VGREVCQGRWEVMDGFAWVAGSGRVGGMELGPNINLKAEHSKANTHAHIS
jgi:hypothetical protein